MTIGKDYPENNISNMFYALENGTAKTGIVNFDRALSSETLIFDTDLQTIRGVCIYDEDISSPAEGSEYTLISIGFFDNGTYKYGITRGSVPTQSSISFLVRCSYRVEGGLLYVTPIFAGNPNYTPFCPGHNYRWIVW